MSSMVQGEEALIHPSPLTSELMDPSSVEEIEGQDESILGDKQAAVIVNGICKSYGRGKRTVSVLQELHMTVQRGNIYGLLGPSGCGKTTLLKCILGMLQTQGGEILTLGHQPGSIGHQVPGRRVGYMPQELALFMMFTIEETLTYFGRLHGMSSKRIAERTDFLINFLSLPDKSRLIQQISGGQQRRTSFAIALLQEPELLILDEPTVGVDPLLRQRIWEHLLSIANTHVTIIITTHYVEEARQAHMVGLMRNGRLLAEAPPDELIRNYNLQTLEDVFLHLCERDQHNDNIPSLTDSSMADVVPRVRHKFVYSVRWVYPSTDVTIVTSCWSVVRLYLKTDSRWHRLGPFPGLSGCQRLCSVLCSWRPQGRNVLAQTIKNFIILKRNIGFLLFEFFLPALQITLFCVCIGKEPYNLRMNVVCNETCVNGSFCGSSDFLQRINNNSIHQTNFGSNFSDALEEVKQGKAWGVINIGENFTQDFKKRFSFPISNETLEGSTIHLHLDMTNQQILMVIQEKLLAAFQLFSMDILETIPYLNPRMAQIPLKMEEPVYGDLHPSFTNFMAPGIILSITFFMATGLTALAFVLERKQGLLDRCMVAGVNNLEIMLGHICTQFVVMTIQVGLLLIFVLAIFKVPYEGPLILVIVLSLLTGLTGMTLGLFVSALVEEETAAIQCALGLVYPNMLLSGIIWPLQSMPQWLQYVSYWLPMTFSAQAMRSVLSRGWGMTHLLVWRGFVTSAGWGLIFILLSAITLRIKGK